jgi:uncharacterized protein YbaR (Trm112 family)
MEELNDIVELACPKDKHPLRSTDNALHCCECDRTYPIVDGIPDFLSGDSQAGLAPVFGGISGITRMAQKMDFFAPIYDSWFFGSVLLSLSGISGGFSRFISRVTSFHVKAFEGITGSVLDVDLRTSHLQSSHRVAIQERVRH